MMRFVRLLRAFARAKDANVAMIFALSLVPLTVAGGVGLDFARGAMVRTSMGEALDAAALAVGGTTSKPTSCDSTAANPTTACQNIQQLAQKYFDANYKVDSSYGTPTTVVVKLTDKDATLSVSDPMPTTLMKIVNLKKLDITAATTVVWGQSKLWVALVLDNSGSMCQPDSQPCVNNTNANSKIYQLKNATKQLLTKLQGASTVAGDVQVAIVPFNRDVAVATTNVNATWLDWTLWNAAPQAGGTTTVTDTYAVPNQNTTSTSSPATIAFTAWGPGDDCPFTDNSNKLTSPFGYYCMPNITNQTTGNKVTAIPSSGTYKGYVCPSLDNGNYNTERDDLYYNGCWTSTKGTGTVQVDKGTNATCSGFSSSNCGCSGSGSSRTCTTQKWVHAWVVNNHNTWGGCLTDRAQNYDISNGTVASSFPPVNPYSSPMIPNSSTQCMNGIITPLEYSWTDLSSKVDAMQAGGSTNQAVGVAHGWQVLTPGSPYGAPTVPSNTSRYIILLSDGLNTQNRWWGDGSTEGTTEDGYIDGRMNSVCTAAKNDGVIIYSLYVHVNGGGNSDPLKNCATDISKYYDLTSSSQIATAFNDIAQQITNLRVAK